MQPYKPDNTFDKLVSLCKRRGFVFQSSEIYGGVGSTWDYGPLGVELKNNVIRAWWQAVVYDRDDMDGLDSAILMNRLVWQYSGHEATFTDPLQDCKNCKKRYRADQVTYNSVREFSSEGICVKAISRVVRIVDENNDKYLKVGLIDITNATGSVVRIEDVKLCINNDVVIPITRKARPGEFPYYDPAVGMELESSSGPIFFAFNHLSMPLYSRGTLCLVVGGKKFNIEVKAYQVEQLELYLEKTCPECGGELTAPRMFNGMFRTHVGPVEDESGLTYLRPETAQGIFVNFLNILQSSRRKLPFGVAQVGKAFRNEITPGNFTFRTREFEQMEIEYFCKPPRFLKDGEKNDEQLHEEWLQARFRWYVGLGIDPARLRQREQEPKELAHYAKRTVDIEYLFPGSLGWSEIEGVANRQDYDLTAHSRDVPDDALARLKLARNGHSTEKLEYFDESYADPQTGKKGAKYVPFVIEPSAGATRATLAFLCEAYGEEQLSAPAEAALAPLREAAAAALKNIAKRIAEAEKRPAEAVPTPGQLRTIESALAAAVAGLPDSLLQVDGACGLPGADRLDLVKKARAACARLCDEHTRVVLRLHPVLAPVTVAVLPLKKNEPAIVETAQRVKKRLQADFRAVYDDTAGIGKLYRRQDEIGTPFCVTVDFQTLQDGTATVRDRDTMAQERCAIDALAVLLRSRIAGWPTPAVRQENA